ncbi:MAG: CsgG/HfaB family protein [candidate division KSB1 bacterium]|nr:CsgG/HfaB family protein [candidate division KSB1 bacterium]MDZ7274468.1 CsgG/HfaB family protein [candidate division KSB1 bacterium]MDZ7284870.1 CsgG/HfaB family protein [candidate division KSB1 bacterium]MDZ7297710.1 CsgG/HfaB family protein [candidate division KSB1 bacterium]MDZ7308279.1 CsgG/HfaB family protein [candidate division KSB1 bacterium]
MRFKDTGWLAILLFLFCVVTASPGQEEKPRIAVLDFQSIGCDSSLGLAASEILRTELGSLGTYRIIERSQLMKVMQEQSLQLSGAVDEQAMVEIGKILGARMVVVGSLVRTGRTFTLNSRFIDVQTAEVRKSQNIRGNSEDEISNMCSSLAKVISEEGTSSGGTVSETTLGRIWLVQESDFTGIWTRRGQSNVFDAVWFPSKTGLRAELTMAEPAGGALEIKRTDQGRLLGTYHGTADVDGRGFHGGATWSAQVAWQGEPYFEAPNTQSGMGAVWVVREGDFTGIWRRLGESNNFEATYFLNKSAVTAELVVESMEKGKLRIKRTSKTGVLGNYQGWFSAGMRHVSGNADWSPNVVWSAEIFY